MKKPAATGPFKLPALPWEESALDPIISARTIGLHHGKHHASYVKNLNELVAGTRLADVSLEQVIAETVGKADQKKIFNNAAQAWNHTFYWNSLRRGSTGAPSADLARRIESDLGGLARFKEDFANAAVECFGSGWAWLAERDGKLEIIATSNAGTPITMGATPLLAIDVWEHAYYLDYENRRPEYAKAVIDRLLNWDFAQQQLERAKGQSRKAA
ncbi:MAG: superoxide dismutase [Usitatibacter sp.]